MIKILAFDPATKFGYAMGPNIGGTWNLTPKKGDHPGKRFYDLVEHVWDVIRWYHPNSVAIELPVGGYTKALAVQNQIIGIIYATCYKYDINVLQSQDAKGRIHYGFWPNTIKKHVTGNGNASKQDVIQAVKKRFPEANIVDNHHADALALWAMVMDRRTEGSVCG